MKTVHTTTEKKQQLVEITFQVMKDVSYYATKKTYYVKILWNGNEVIFSRPVNKQLINKIIEINKVDYTIYMLYLHNKIRNDEKKIYKLISNYLGRLTFPEI